MSTDEDESIERSENLRSQSTMPRGRAHSSQGWDGDSPDDVLVVADGSMGRSDSPRRQSGMSRGRAYGPRNRDGDSPDRHDATDEDGSMATGDSPRVGMQAPLGRMRMSLLGVMMVIEVTLS